MNQIDEPRSTPWNENDFTRRIGVEYPIVQGPLGGGFSTAQLAAAVSNGGGLGSFGAHANAPEEMATIVQSIRALTDKPFAVNLWVSRHDPGVATLTREAYDRAASGTEKYFDEFGVRPPAFPPELRHTFADQIRALINAAPPVFSFVFGIPPRAILEECRRKGIFTIGTATTPEEAQAINAAGVDAIVASGFEGGGHRGSFLGTAEESLTGTFALLPQVVDVVTVPVIAAGGVGDARGIAAAFALGAAAVQIGTAFLACEESNATPLHRSMLFGAEGRRTGLSRLYSGRLARGMRNRFMQETAESRLEPLPYPVQGALMKPVFQKAVEQERGDLLPLWAGQGAHLLRHRKATDLMASLVSETDGLLARLPAPCVGAGREAL